jgi:DNA-binding IclR family transcriptional regulator
MDKEHSGIQVIARAAAILRAVGRDPVSLGTLARQTGLPRSTVQRIVDALAAEQFLEAGETGVRLGWGLARLAQLASSDVVLAVRPHLEDLFASTHESVDIAARHGAEVSFLDRIVSDQELRVVPITDKPRPLHAMANGKAILAGMADAEVERLMAGKLVRLTDTTITTMPALLAELATIRENGFSYDREEHVAGVCAIGATIAAPGLAPHAISVAVPASRFYTNLESLQESVQLAKHAIEATLTDLQESGGQAWFQKKSGSEHILARKRGQDKA